MNGISVQAFIGDSSLNTDQLIDNIILNDQEITRARRLNEHYINNELKKTEWTVLMDSPLPAEKQDEWKEYRQQLKNLLISEEDNLIWPVKPA